MSDASAALARIDTLIPIALGLAQGTTTGRMLLATAADRLEPIWIPERWQGSVGRALERARVASPEPLALDAVERVLRHAWGVRSLDDVIGDLSPTPVSTGHTAQVHRAEHDGRPVAITVQRPGLAGAVRQDLALAAAMAGSLGGAAAGSEWLTDRLDLEQAAAHMRRCRRRWAGPGVGVPAPVSALCRENVLVADWVDGRPLCDAEGLAGGVGWGHDPTAGALVRFLLGALREGLVLADLGPDDVLLLPDGTLAITGFTGVVAIDGPGCADAALTILEEFDAGAFPALAGLLGPLGAAEPSRLDAAALTALVRRAETGDAAVASELRAIRRRLGDRRALALAAVAGTLGSLLARIGAHGVWREQAAAALRHGWAAD